MNTNLAGPLSLQGVELDLETPSELRMSGNSVYTCVAISGLSVGC